MNMSKMEKRMLINKHLKEGYTFKEATSLIEMECDKLSELSKELNKKKKEKKKDFNVLFSQMARSQ